MVEAVQQPSAESVGRWFVITWMFQGVIEFRNWSLAMYCTRIDVFIADFGHLTYSKHLETNSFILHCITCYR